MRLIDADALKEEINKKKVVGRFNTLSLIDAAPTVELDESIIQEVLNKRCMTAVANEYLIALHGNRQRGKWIRKVDEVGFISHICSECGAEIEVEDPIDDKFCFNCGADMRGEEKHEYKCDICKHLRDCVRARAFLMANVYPYSDGCESFEEGGKE